MGRLAEVTDQEGRSRSHIITSTEKLPRQKARNQTEASILSYRVVCNNFLLTIFMKGWAHTDDGCPSLQLCK